MLVWHLNEGIDWLIDCLMNLFIFRLCPPWTSLWILIYLVALILQFSMQACTVGSTYRGQFYSNKAWRQGSSRFSHINFVIKYKKITVTGIWNKQNWTASTWDILQSTCTQAMDLVQWRPELSEQCRHKTDAMDTSARTRVRISPDECLCQHRLVRKEKIFLLLFNVTVLPCGALL